MYHLLVVENEDPLREWYEQELREEGYEITAVSNGQDALQKLEETAFDAIILDIKMPGMDGLEFLEKVLGEKRETPVIINTAYPRYKHNFMSWAAEAYVVKSSKLDELKRTIREVLEKYYKKEKKNG